MVSNGEGLQNGTNTTRGSTSEATEARNRTHGDEGKNKATKTSNNTNGQTREPEQYLPTANVVRIMRRALPANAKVGDEAKEMMQDCVTEFISFCTSEANDACQMEHRRTITAEDLIRAMSRLGFDHYVEPLMLFLQKYRESETLPTFIGPNVLHGLNTASRVAGANGLMPPTNDGLPPFAVPTLVPPQYAMFGSSGNGLYYHNGSGQSSGAGNMGQHSVGATVHGGNGHSLGPGIMDGQSAGNGLYYHNGSGQSSGAGNMSHDSVGATGHGGNGPSLGSGIMGGQSAGDGGTGPSGSRQAKTEFYDP